MPARRPRSSGCGSDARARRRRRQYRRQQGQRRPHRRLCRGRAKRWRRSRDYLTINISSPNTPGLRGLQDEGALDRAAGRGAARRAAGKPMFLKVAPDLGDGDPERIVRVGDRSPDRRADRRQHHRVAPAAQVALRIAKRAGFPGAPLKPLALEALRAVPVGERRRNPADRRRAGSPAPTTPGSGSAPAPAWSSSIRRWSTKGRASPGASPRGWPSG